MNSPIAVGSILADTYRITAQLGVGGMGSVWTAEHLRLPGKRVAIKVLHTTLATGDVLLRFRREAEIASRIGHPNIVEVLDFNALPGGEPFLVMELLSGESLASRLRRGPLPEKTAIDIARQIGSALFAAHAMNVVHRDLKPDNIFLCPRDVDGELRDQVKVLDFGISKIRNSQTVVTQDAAVMGTPYYMSPEQASGKNQEIDGRTDIFALGAILFEMLTGKTAFPGDSVPAVIFQVVFQPHPPILQIAPDTSPKVAAAIDRALAKDPGERFQDMATFIEVLTGRPLMAVTGVRPAASSNMASAAGLEKTVAAPDATGVPVARTHPAPTQKAPTRRAWLWVVMVVVAVAAAAGIGFVLRGSGKTVVAPASQGGSVPPGTTATTDLANKASANPVEKTSVQATAKPAEVGDKPDKVPDPPDKSAEKSARPKAPANEEALPPAVAAELDAAEKALANRDIAEAVRRARHSQYDKKTARASSVLTRAFCLQGDLGAAKAELQHVTGPERARVVRACRAAGMEL